MAFRRKENASMINAGVGFCRQIYSIVIPAKAGIQMANTDPRSGQSHHIEVPLGGIIKTAGFPLSRE
jgi:hypothetical protein